MEEGPNWCNCDRLRLRGLRGIEESDPRDEEDDEDDEEDDDGSAVFLLNCVGENIFDDTEDRTGFEEEEDEEEEEEERVRVLEDCWRASITVIMPVRHCPSSTTLRVSR